jgi:RecA-family ATPase
LDADTGFSIAASKPAFWVDQDDSWDEAAIPQRQWVALRYLMLRKVSLLIGSPAAGKSLLALQWGIGLALNQPLGDFKPIALPGHQSRRRRVLVLNAEDDADEQRRRIAALIRPFGRNPADLDGHLTRVGPEEVGWLFERDAITGEVMPTKGLEDLKTIMRERSVDVIILDPLAELLSGIDENSNGDINSVLAKLRSLAIDENIAVLVVHHTRKGVAVPGSLEAARGASSLGGSVRVALTLTGMTEDEATAAGIPTENRKYYSRLDDAKQSYTQMSDAIWFEKQSIVLANGDTAPMLSPWAVPKDMITPEIKLKVENGIAKGIAGEPWSPTFSNKPRSVRNLMIESGVTTGEGQKKLLGELLEAGFEKVKFQAAGGRPELGIRSPDGKPSSVRWRDNEASDEIK